MKISVLSLTDAQRSEIAQRSTGPGWELLTPQEVPSFLPDSLRGRAVEVMKVVAGSSTGGTVVMYNVHRVDAPDKAIDHTPFVVVIHATGASAAGHFVHHGKWDGRTTPIEIPDDFEGEVTSSGVAQYYRARPPAGRRSGDLSELRDGDAAAFKRVTGSAPWRIAPGSVGAP